MKNLIVDKKYNGKKLDKFLIDNINNLSYNLFYKTLRKKDIKLIGNAILNNQINQNNIKDATIIDCYNFEDVKQDIKKIINEHDVIDTKSTKYIVVSLMR